MSTLESERDDLTVELEAVGLGVFVRDGDRDTRHDEKTWVSRTF